MYRSTRCAVFPGCSLVLAGIAVAVSAAPCLEVTLTGMLGGPLGAKRQGPHKIPGVGLSEQDCVDVVRAGAYGGRVIVGTDFATLRPPAK